MPWKVQSPMSLREEFVAFASQADANVAALCRRFCVSRKTGYKWLARFRAGGEAPLADRPRRPLTSPARTGDAVERLVVALRRAHPAWGARKLKRRLEGWRTWATRAPCRPAARSTGSWPATG